MLLLTASNCFNQMKELVKKINELQQSSPTTDKIAGGKKISSSEKTSSATSEIKSEKTTTSKTSNITSKSKSSHSSESSGSSESIEPKKHSENDCYFTESGSDFDISYLTSDANNQKSVVDEIKKM